MKNKVLLSITYILVILSLLSSLLLVGCSQEKDNGEHVKEDLVLPLSSIELLDVDPLLKLALDIKNSTITLDKNGTFSIDIAVFPAVIKAANALIEDVDFENLDIFGGDLEDFFEIYAGGLFPGFTIKDVGGGFDIIRAALGLSLVGFDFEDPFFAGLADSLAETGTLPNGLQIPTDREYALSLSAPYTIRELESPYSGKYTGVYLGQLRENEETYVVMTAKTDEDKNITGLKLRIEFLSLTIVAGDFDVE